MTWQREAKFTSQLVAVVVSYRALLLVDIDHNCMRTGFEVRACIAPLPHRRKKIGCVS